MMTIGDFYCGMKGWSQAFIERGHEVITYDNQEIFKPDVCGDLLDIEDFPKLDGALLSPPCHTTSTMTMEKNWTYDNAPKTPEAENAKLLFLKCYQIIHRTEPKFFIIENPRCRTRTLGFFDLYERRTITMCRYGLNRMKPTDLWGGFPPSLKLRPMCKNNWTPWRTESDHLSSRRGSQNGTQGMDSAQAAKIPYELSLEVCLAMEKDIHLTSDQRRSGESA